MHEHSKELSSRAVAYVSIDDLFGISASPMVKDAIELAAVSVPLDKSKEPGDTLLTVWSDKKRELDMASTTLAFQVRNLSDIIWCKDKISYLSRQFRFFRPYKAFRRSKSG